MNGRLVRCLGASLLALSLVRVLRSDDGDDTRVPFVAGYDRFALHGDIEPLAAGRLLLGELSCTRCHATAESLLAAKGGPRLDGVAARLNRAWMESFIAAPREVNPGTTMPDVLADRDATERAAVAKSLAAYLSTQRRPPADVKGSGLLPVPHEFWNKGDAAQGAAIYHQVGCVACHDSAQEIALAPPTSPVDQLLQDLDEDELAEMGLAAAARVVHSVPHSDLKSKFTASGLTHFLLDPISDRPGGRMPAAKLSPVEAADVASYLLENQAPRREEPDADQHEIDRGRRLFVELACVQCHAVGDQEPPPLAKPLNELDASQTQHCLSADAAQPINYGLDARQTQAIRAALAAAKQRTEIPAGDQLELQLLAFNCYACHEREGRGGVGRFRRDHFETVAKIDLGDEGRLPPPLTGVGRKLQPVWLKNVLLGKKTDLRSHMQIRMPAFRAELANRMPDLFRGEDGPDERNEQAVFGETQPLVDVGRQLMDVGCVQCHAFGGNAMPGVIGIDLRGVGKRVQPAWFREFLLNPGSIKSRTRMPSFFADGKSQRLDLLDGNVDRQIAAMWAYLNAAGDLELPDKIKQVRAQNYELRPVDAPLMLRTFMNEAGTHAIAVGFPERVHYAFDAEKLRLAVGWRGRFLDAQGTWFVRSAPPAGPLGEAAVQFPHEATLAKLTDSTQAWPKTADKCIFSGYRLDTRGVPTLLYRFEDIEIEDRLEPLAAPSATQVGLRRTMTLRRVKAAVGASRVWLLAAADKKLTRVAERSYRDGAGLETTLDGLTGQLRTTAGRDEWIVPIELDETLDESLTVELQYRW